MTLPEDFRLNLVTAPASEPVSLEEAKRRIRVGSTVTAEDEDIATSIVAARKAVERETGRALITQTWEGRLDYFPGGMEIPFPKPPFQSVVSVKYIDTDGNEQTLATTEYTADATGELGRIFLQWGKSWPSTRVEPNTVRIQWKAGYGDDPKDVDEELVREIWAKVSETFVLREPHMAGTVVSKNPAYGAASAGNRVGL